MSHLQTNQTISGVQIEVNERPYEQHMDRPLIEVTRWESLDESRTLLFEETDSARRIVEPAGMLLGRIHPNITTALESLGYEIRE